MISNQLSFMRNYRAPWWLPGGHLQTIWPTLFGRPRPAEALRMERDRWRAPDGDFIDVDHLCAIGQRCSGELVPDCRCGTFAAEAPPAQTVARSANQSHTASGMA